jgi:hypothetical protein
MNISTLFYLPTKQFSKWAHVILFIQLVYGLHALMPTQYLLPTTNFATSQDFSMTLVFNTQLSKLEKLEES